MLTNRGFRYLRFRERLTQRQFGARIGVSVALVDKIECGKRPISARTHRLVRAAFGLTDAKINELEERGA
ncbi:helix-turn-helix domain-containing protein [Geomicrobium sediminis]|uniref:Transcriptional regulator with XRE-family HTH domain n=1 Tax=Geomicrobium sediminis TaxID=1347788 RepID=A0ABS2PHM4_9BACL|nr:transcriptional regulator with XRE-family HTH domain [Geomicrobium sediminis]